MFSYLLLSYVLHNHIWKKRYAEGQEWSGWKAGINYAQDSETDCFGSQLYEPTHIPHVIFYKHKSVGKSIYAVIWNCFDRCWHLMLFWHHLFPSQLNFTTDSRISFTIIIICIFVILGEERYRREEASPYSVGQSSPSVNYCRRDKWNRLVALTKCIQANQEINCCKLKHTDTHRCTRELTYNMLERCISYYRCI